MADCQNSTETQTCRVCNISYEATTAYFYKEKKGSIRLHKWCKKCCALYVAKRNGKDCASIENSFWEKMKEKEKKKTDRQRGYKTCSKCNQSKIFDDFGTRKTMNGGPIEVCKVCASKYQAEYYKRNNEAIKIKSKNRYHGEKKEEIRIKRNEFYKKNRESIQEKAKAYRKSNPEIIRNAGYRYYARRKNANGSHTVQQIRELFVKQKGKCAACKIKLYRYHRDHIIPLSKGGSNDIHNIQLLCGSCNVTKSARDVIEFMNTLGYLL